MKRVLTNDFSWSKSRHEKLAECERAYFFPYYRSWGGWEQRAPEEVKTLFGLKKLHSRFTWAGSAVHGAVRDALRSYRAQRPVDAAALIERVHQDMLAQFRHSKARRYRADRRTFEGLVEHEYDEPVAPAEWKRNWDTVKGALEWFFASRWPALAQAIPAERWLEVDENDFDHSSFLLDGVKVFAVPDFAWLEEDGTPRVVDWKTGGAREGYDDQVIGYAMYVAERYRLDVMRVRTSLVFLNAGTEQEVAISPEALARFREHFEESTGRMRALLADPAANVARDADAFPLTTDLTRCARCVFRRPCGRTGG